MSTDSTERALAERIVSGVIAGMIAAVAAATVVGFWLSYTGLHDFAIRAAMRGPEAWAFPASIDLFIAAGEAGVTISALRRRRDPLAWGYLGVGFAASVTGNVLHVDPAVLPWARYAVAAVPPMAAMLALAALLRHVYRLALDAHLAVDEAQPVSEEQEPEALPVSTPAEPLPGAAALLPSVRSSPLPKQARTRTEKRARSAPVVTRDPLIEFASELASGVLPSRRAVQPRMHVGWDRAGEIRADLEKTITEGKGALVGSNGNGAAHA